MLTFSLLRHAKSSWNDPSLDDFDRPLAPRGQKAAPLIGRWMAQHDMRPDLVLSSPSARTRETCALVFKSLGFVPPLTFDETIYQASPRTLLALARGVPGEVRHLMLVGHNPGLHALATTLIGDGPLDLRARLDDKLPSAGLVIMTSDAATFSDLKPGAATLVHFVTPRMLQE